MWPALVSILPGLLDKIIPDPTAAADAKLKALELAQKGDLAALDADMRLMLAQTEINKAEAATGNTFVASWRPSVGYVCVMGLFYSFLLQPLLPWIAVLFGKQVPPLPSLDSDVLLTLVSGMLGIGSLRSIEKIRGVSK